jgi:hypothetical protein
MPSNWRCTKKFSQNIAEIDPNKLADAVQTSNSEASDVVCSFLGKTFYGNDKVCWKGSEYICTPEGWTKTGKTC